MAGSKVSSSGSDAAGSGSAAGAEWAHVVPKPERGCLLLAHPLMFSDTQTYFNQSVIFMLEHDDTQGSYGLILNRPSRFRISEALRQQAAAQGGGAGADSKEGSVLGSFGDCRLYVGGDVGDGMSLHMIHGQPGLAEAQEVVKGIWMWGLDAARQGLAEGRFRPQDFRWFAKYAGWGPGQLARECQMGVWFAAAASPSVILREPSSADGADLWHHVLTLMGGDYEQLSRNVKEAEAQAQAEAEGKRAAQRGGGDDAAGSAPSSETGGK